MKRPRPAKSTTSKSSHTIRWPIVMASGLAGAVVVVLYFIRLGGLIGPGPGETYTIQQLSSLNGLLHDPLLLPYKLLAFLLIPLPGSSVGAVRLASALIALASVVLFYLLARRWYGSLNSTIITFLFATSGWMLQHGRYGAGYVLPAFFVLLLLVLAVWSKHSERSNWLTVGYGVTFGLAWLVPSGVWFVAICALLIRSYIAEQVRESQTAYRAVAAAVALTGLGAALAGYITNPSIVLQGFGLPNHIPAFIVIAKQAVFSIGAFIVRGPDTPETWLAHTPLLDVATSTLLVLGAIFYGRHFDNQRTQLLAAFAVLGVVIVTLNGAPALGLLLPVVYLVAGGGLSYFLHLWKRVFPRNPIANATSVVAVCLLVVAAASFHVQRYYVAWLHSPATTAVYRNDTAKPQLPYLVQ